LTECITKFWDFIYLSQAGTADELKDEVQAKYGKGVITFAPYSDPEFRRKITGAVKIDSDLIETGEWPGYANVPILVDTNLVKTKGWERHGLKMQGAFRCVRV
jgi:hypothetical protein